jgi:hypothetical protein
MAVMAVVGTPMAGTAAVEAVTAVDRWTSHPVVARMSLDRFSTHLRQKPVVRGLRPTRT